MFGNPDALVQIDMSEYGEKFNVSRLVGAPPGYVGYEEGGQLTEKIRRRPYSIVLLDEIEKAHPDVFNILLQVMEDGRLTDSFGRRVDFRNTVVIMTSNIGVDVLKRQGDLGFRAQSEADTYEAMKQKLMDEAKRTFRPEFLNRVDDVIVFHQLLREDLEKVIEIELQEVKTRLKDRNMELELSAEVLKFLIDKGYDPAFGARPLKRTIQRYIENVLAEDILGGKFKEGDALRAEIRGDYVAFEKAS
jgi:ATP-dependent Clp protease ATP-binding subunit ClpC